MKFHSSLEKIVYLFSCLFCFVWTLKRENSGLRGMPFDKRWIQWREALSMLSCWVHIYLEQPVPPPHSQSFSRSLALLVCLSRTVSLSRRPLIS